MKINCLSNQTHIEHKINVLSYAKYTHTANLLQPPVIQLVLGRNTVPHIHFSGDQTFPDHRLSSSPAEGAVASSAPGKMRSRSIPLYSWRKSEQLVSDYTDIILMREVINHTHT